MVSSENGERERGALYLVASYLCKSLPLSWPFVPFPACPLSLRLRAGEVVERKRKIRLEMLHVLLPYLCSLVAGKARARDKVGNPRFVST